MPDGSMPDGRSCAKCDAKIPARAGNGRPRKYCLACSPRRRELKPLQLSFAIECCLAEGCDRGGKLVRGLCRMHYAKWWHEQNPGYQREWEARNPGYTRDYLRRWRAENPERQDAIAKRYYAKNREACVARSVARKRGVRMASADTLVYRDALLSDPCAYCGADATDVDHINPIVAGGSNEWWNLTAACRTCNARKGRRTLLEFLCLDTLMSRR